MKAAKSSSGLPIILQIISDAQQIPEVAFTGDTTIAFLDLPGADLALKAKLLIMELTYLHDIVTPDGAKVCEINM